MTDYPIYNLASSVNHSVVGTQTFPAWLTILTASSPPQTVFSNKGLVISNDAVNSCQNALTYSDLSSYQGDPLQACNGDGKTYNCGWEYSNPPDNPPGNPKNCDNGGHLNCQHVTGSCCQAQQQGLNVTC